MDKYARFRYQPCLPLGNDGRRVTACREHTELSRKAAAEGMVLLKNDNSALPLPKGTKVALFGKASIEYIKGGGGSGDVNVPYIRNIYDGFIAKEKEGKLNVYEPVTAFYKEYVKRESVKIPTQKEINAVWDIVNNMEFCQKRDDMTYDTFASMHVQEPEVPEQIIKDAALNADTAVMIISRFSAEGVDRRPQPGDYYLTDNEKDIINKLGESFKKLIVVINSGGLIDCEFLSEKKEVKAILMGWQGGLEGGMAIADLITGDVNPSGRLPDTIAKSYDDYPGSQNFNESFSYVNYTEDIYVGYRYFETIPGAYDKVRYPFGYGLSYTKFKISDVICGEENGKITIAATVKNVGSRSGKDVLEVYYSAPQGKLQKPFRELICFDKTKLLNPGEEQTLALSFDVKNMASFDDLGKIQKAAYVLEKGEYKIYLGASVRDCKELDYKYIVAEDTVTEQLTSLCRPFKLKKRLLADGTYEELPVGDEKYICGENKSTEKLPPEKTVMFNDVGEKISLDNFVSQFTLEELMNFVGGTPPTGVANTGCFGGLRRLAVPAVPTADGPAGLRLDTETGIYTTAWPCATLLAATFNKKIAFEVGAAGGAEVRENNIGIWLSPAQNIHRDPLCGRNFEYFSEDPVLTGEIASSEIRGVQSQKVAVSMKHFACNNKEANRFNSDSRVSERALREIYLKGFEISVKKGDPWTIMSSYNLINGQHTSESYELLTGILRKEWGFKGMVTTDWGVKNDPVKEVKAGNDMKMPIGYPDDLMKGYKEGRLTRVDLEICVKRILEMVRKTAE